ncbi:MAG: hypothetical protein M3Y33_21930, partial [Actinomycetota bacterium]|nr:hypothetical protein [Actinomycetota bacterium]
MRLPSGQQYWTVLDDDLRVVAVADGFLRHQRFGRDGAESTTKAYAHAIALFLRWCARTGRSWQAGVEQFALFMTWLAHAGPSASGADVGGRGPGVLLAGPGIAPGQVNLRALPVLVVVEVLAGLQTRLRGGLRLTDVVLRAIGDTLRRQQAASIRECDPDLAPGKRARSVLRAFTRDVRRALADPGREQSKDTWDLAIFGHPGTLSFTKITQAWLVQAAKRWAAEQLPRHRGSGAARVQAKINSVGLLSQYLHGRPDQGDDPAALGRGDLESFLSRLAYLEATGEISRYRRNMICRDVRAVLAGIRALGLTRA